MTEPVTATIEDEVEDLAEELSDEALDRQEETRACGTICSGGGR
jgi:hypothetical protein